MPIVHPKGPWLVVNSLLRPGLTPTMYSALGGSPKGLTALLKACEDKAAQRHQACPTVAPLMMLRCVCALEAGGFGVSSAGSRAGRSGAPEADITKYKNASDLLSPFPTLLREYPCRSRTLYGVLHTWNSNLRDKRFRRARDIRAIFWVATLTRASIAAQATLPVALTALWRVPLSLVCVTAPRDGRAELPKSFCKSRS